MHIKAWTGFPVLKNVVNRLFKTNGVEQPVIETRGQWTYSGWGGTLFALSEQMKTHD